MIESHLNISRTGACRLTLILAFLLSSLSCSSGLPETASRGRDDAQPANAGEAGEGPAENEPASNRVQLSEEAYRSAGIQVAAVERRTIQLTLRVTGALALDETRSSRIDTPVGGRIVRISVLPGDAVQPGRVLAEVESAELTESVVSLRSAAAEAALRSQETERSRTLFDAKGLSRAELLRRESAEAQARSALTGARQRLGIMGLDAREIDSLIHIGEPSGAGDYDDAVPLAKIRSPRAGRVIASNGMPGQRVSPDQHVAPGEELFLVADTSRLWLILQVHEKDLPGLIAGESVEVHASAYPDIPFHGSIAAIGDLVDPHTRTLAARVAIDNSGGRLKAGMYVEALVLRAATAASRIAVPAGAVVKIGSELSVFVAVGDRQFERRKVEAGQSSDQWIEVLSGLAEGEKIAVKGAFALNSETIKGSLVEEE